MQTNEPNYAEIALAHSHRTGEHLANIERFAIVTGFPIDDMRGLYRLFSTIKHKKHIYVDGELLSLLGYKGPDWSSQQHLLKSLQHCQLGSDYFTYDNSEYAAWCKSAYSMEYAPNSRYAIAYIGLLYPNPTSFEGKPNKKHILLTARCFRKVAMQLCTDAGDAVREYYCKLEDLFEAYVAYNTAYNEIVLRQRYDALEARHDALEMRLNRVDQINKLLLANKADSPCAEVVFISASYNEFLADIYHINFSTTGKPNLGALNHGRVAGDTMVILREFITADARALMGRIKTDLRHLRPTSAQYFKGAYAHIVHYIEDLLNKLNDSHLVYSATMYDMVTTLCQPSVDRWYGVPDDARQRLLDTVALPAPHHAVQVDDAPVRPLIEPVATPALRGSADEVMVAVDQAEPTMAAPQVDDAQDVHVPFAHVDTPIVEEPPVVEPPKPKPKRQYKKSELPLPVEEARAIVAQALAGQPCGASVCITDVMRDIPALLPRGGKSTFRAKPWKPLVKEECDRLGLVVQTRRVRKQL